LQPLVLDAESLERLKASMRKIWRANQQSSVEKVRLLSGTLEQLRNRKNELVAALAGDAELADDLREAIAPLKTKIAETEAELDKARDYEQDFIQFCDFAFDIVADWSKHWWSLEHNDQQRCKQILFPAGFSLDADKKVYTPEISIIYSGAITKTAPEGTDFTNLEGPVGLEPTTPCLKGRCSNRLSYGPSIMRHP
jgi:hypothetical protein